MTWQYLLRHLGHWQGSFTRLSPQGVIQEDTPTLVVLEGLNDNTSIRQVIQRFEPDTGAVTNETVLEYSSLSRSILIFENGAFSQGSMQLGPLSEFGAEFGFVEGDRRLRLVELYQPGGTFSQITLIREQRQGTDDPERPPLTVEALLGEWHGTAITLYPDFRTPDTYATQVQIRQQDEKTLEQRLSTNGFELKTTATINGNILQFQQGPYPFQVLLLPDGASCGYPPQIPTGKAFLLEAGWLIAPNHRQRMIRRYDARGGWTSLTLVSERKVSNG